MKIRFVSVATGLYVKYWADFVESVIRSYGRLTNRPDVSFALLTNNFREAEKFVPQSEAHNFHLMDFSEQGWPNATIMRYAAYRDNAAQITKGVDFLIHVDADILMRRPIPVTTWSQLDKKGLLLVKHPGYYRSENPVVRLYANSKGNLRKQDQHRIELMGAIGDWETNPLSTAFVEKARRSTYVCGGVWFASPGRFAQFVGNIAKSVELDEQNHVMAKWHDESHLNSWSVKNPAHHGILGPEFCFAPGYAHLLGKRPILEAVEKGNDRVR